MNFNLLTCLTARCSSHELPYKTESVLLVSWLTDRYFQVQMRSLPDTAEISSGEIWHSGFVQKDQNILNQQIQPTEQETELIHILNTSPQFYLFCLWSFKDSPLQCKTNRLIPRIVVGKYLILINTLLKTYIKMLYPF